MSHHLLTLKPNDVLFFKDGRPMDGSSAGHGAAWPLPHTLDSALHHALHRAGYADLHGHTAKRSGVEFKADRENHGRQLGSLQSAGPFPVDSAGRWYFPRPADADQADSFETTHRQLECALPGSASSLHSKLRHVLNTRPPRKDKAEKWLSTEAYNAYLGGKSDSEERRFLKDDAIFTTEHNVGIGMDPATGSTVEGAFYSASYLRLRSGFQLGIIATCMDKGSSGKEANVDLIEKTFPNSNARTHILAGGQQRACTVERKTQATLPLPLGASIDGTRVRWTLLTPAIFPHLPATAKNPTGHPGGWLPSWIHPDSLAVQLKDPEASARGNEGRENWRKRVAALDRIPATLVAAIIPRALPVTGWALMGTDDLTGTLDAPGGARATHLAVPAGAVYCFECDDEPSARALAAALNWHGSSPGTEIQNRRSTLMGEKGFGLGVCSSWSFHPGT